MLKHFFAFTRTQFNAQVKVVRSDTAKELCEGNMLILFQNLGIQHQRSCRDSPQQNGVIERKHKHLLETARALYF